MTNLSPFIQQQEPINLLFLVISTPCIPVQLYLLILFLLSTIILNNPQNLHRNLDYIQITFKLCTSQTRHPRRQKHERLDDLEKKEIKVVTCLFRLRVRRWTFSPPVKAFKDWSRMWPWGRKVEAVVWPGGAGPLILRLYKVKSNPNNSHWEQWDTSDRVYVI